MRLSKIKFLLVNSYILFNILHAVPTITLSDLKKINKTKITHCTKFNQQFEIRKSLGEYLYFSDKGIMGSEKNYYALATNGFFYLFSHEKSKWVHYFNKFEICDSTNNQIILRNLNNIYFTIRMDLDDLDFYIIKEGIPLNHLKPQYKLEHREVEQESTV